MPADLRPGLEQLPHRIASLPIDARGYPVPWFVGWVEGVPDFRTSDARKFVRAVKERRCWICGQALGVWLAFPIGPMCAITRTISEPPSHRECAEWSIRNCPLLSQPAMVRRDTNLPAEVDEPGGIAIKRNPGVVCLWITRSFEIFKDSQGKPLITIGSPTEVTWWREGRRATRAEVEASVESGFPTLLAVARAEGPFAIEALGKQTTIAEQLYPPAASGEASAG